MRTLFLYSDGNGMARAAMIEHSEDFDTCSEGNILAVQERVADFNYGGTFFFVEMPDEEFRPALTTEDGDEVALQFLNM